MVNDVIHRMHRDTSIEKRLRDDPILMTSVRNRDRALYRPLLELEVVPTTSRGQKLTAGASSIEETLLSIFEVVLYE